MSIRNVSRRRFLKLGATAGGGLIIGVNLPGCSFSGALPIEQESDGFIPHAFLQITPDNQVIFYCPSDEMGQGVRTGLATIIGEELDFHPQNMLVKAAGLHEDYANPEFGVQATGGSNAVRAFWGPLRQAGADTRALLLNAAAQDLGVSASELTTDNGYVIVGDDRFPYGDFVTTAAQLAMPIETPLKSSASFRYIGSEFSRVDALAKSTGTAEFGIDADIPGMVYAVVVRAPVAGARVLSVDKTAAVSMPGVVAIVPVSSGIAVVANAYWRAKNAAQVLEISWEEIPLGQVSSAQVRTDYEAALAEGDTVEASNQGELAAGFAAASSTLEADYFAPFLAHTPLEPVNATLHISDNSAELWTGVQSIQGAQGLVERLTGLPRSNIRVNNLYLGGGFGRRGTLTHIVEVTEIAMAIDKPVQLLWSREDDIRNGLYRPASLMRIKAGVTTDGIVSAWDVQRAGGNITSDTLTNMLPALLPSLPSSLLNGLSGFAEYLFSQWTVDPSSVEGLHETYDFENHRIAHATVDHGLPLTFWRSVGHSYTAFAVESMMDELADRAGIDPVSLRLANTQNKPRMQGVLQTAQAAMKSMTVPDGHHLGIAAHSSFATDVAEIAEVSIENGEIRVHKVTCVADVGTAINPDIVRAQLEGAVMFGLTATLYGRIDLDQGEVKQSNFHDYPILRMDRAPAVDVILVDSGGDPTGIGEPGVPPIAPAVANAVFKATGQRLRELPLKLA
jgi:isoquinoline 1-oxidoreductase beta subunit